MIRRILFIFSLPLLALACSKGGFVVNGTVEKGVPMGDSVYLQKIDKGRVVTLGRAAVKNLSFTIEGNCEEPQLAYLVTLLNGRPRSKAELYVEPGDINVSLNAVRPVLSGTEHNVRLQEYKDSIDILDRLFMQYYEKSKIPTLSQKGAEEADKGMKVVSLVRKDYVNRFMEKNIDNIVSGYILSKNYETMEPEQGLEYIARMSAEQKADTVVKHIESTFRNKIATAEGQPFVDFQAVTNDGKRVKLSDYVGKGKVVVLNIWGTNRQAVATDVAAIKAVAEEYKESVQVLGFAVDTDAAQWNTVIKENGMWWQQISDLRGWGSKAIFSYGVNSYPYNIVFAADGTILKKGVKVEELPALLAK
ncbi:MAG: AhpC/TSA family protein [Bacteroidaceae bacterium]|nr:AhpC/TSA family protein [Bacteroidaceae bacterium]